MTIALIGSKGWGSASYELSLHRGQTRLAGSKQRALLALLARFGRRAFRLRGSRFATGDCRDVAVGELQIEPGTRGNRTGTPLRLAVAIAHKDETAGKNLLIAERLQQSRISRKILPAICQRRCKGADLAPIESRKAMALRDDALPLHPAARR